MRVNDRLELIVLRPAFGGETVARAPDGRVVFLSGGAPRDRVVAEVTTVRKRWARGVVLRRLVAGDAWVEPYCALAQDCGGCPWQQISRTEQHRALTEHVQRVLGNAAAKQPGGPPEWRPMVVAEPDTGWRSTARFQWDSARLGYHRPGTQEVVDIEHCPALSPELVDLHARVRGRLQASLAGRGTLRLTAAPGASSGTVALHPKDNLAVARLERALDRFVGGADGCHGGVLVRPDGRLLAVGEPSVRFDGVIHPATGFVQAHRPLNLVLVATALAWLEELVAPPGPVLELFSGSGNFTSALVRRGYSVIAAEQDEAAAAALSRALPEVDLVVGDFAYEASGLTPRGLLLDPPRAGAPTLPELAREGLVAILYVSCHPSTLARDVEALIHVGWRLQRVQPFELFPHTGHVEVLARLAHC